MYGCTFFSASLTKLNMYVDGCCVVSDQFPEHSCMCLFTLSNIFFELPSALVFLTNIFPC